MAICGLSNSSGGISVAVTIAEPSKKIDMMPAAVASSIRVWRMRPWGFSGVSSGSPLISGITATPVSKPLRPSANLGNSNTLMATIASGPCPETGGACSKYQFPSMTFVYQVVNRCGWATRYTRPLPMTNRFSSR